MRRRRRAQLTPILVEGQDFSLHGKDVVTEANLRDEYYWKLVADFIGPQTGEGLELGQTSCKNRLMIQVGLLREDNNFAWIAIIEWLKKVFPGHQSADFRRLIERGIATTLSLGSDARLSFLESEVNFNFVGPICDSIGVERQHLLELRDFSERAKLIEVTNGLILELSNFVAREKISPIVIVSWLTNFHPEYCKNGDTQKAYKVLRSKIKKLKVYCRNYETRSHRKNAAIESVLQSPFELVPKKEPKLFMKKRRRDENERSFVKEESEAFEIFQSGGSGLSREAEASRRDASLETDDRNGERSNPSHGRRDDYKGEPLTLLDIGMLSVQKLSEVYGGKTQMCRKVSFDLLKNHYVLTYKEHPALEDFEQTLETAPKDCTILTPLVFLNYNANFLVDLHDAVEQQIMTFEKEIILSTGEKLGRDKLPQFQNFVNLPESATSRFVHMTCDILSPRRPNRPNYRKHWVAFCEEKGNPCRLVVNQANRLTNYFEAAAGLIHHHSEIALFFSDLLSMTNDLCPNVILESVVADANDSMIQSFACVLAIVYCKVLGPYLQLLKSGGEYVLFSQYLLFLYQKFIDWSKNPSTLLEPVESNVFMQFPVQEKVFHRVFSYCGQWHTNRDLIRACLKRTIKVIAAVTEDHLKVFLPGGTLSKIPPDDVCLNLVSCTFSVLMADYPFSHAYPYSKKREEKSSQDPSKMSLSDSSQDDDDLFGDSADDSAIWRQTENSPQAKKRRAQEEREEIMDKDYIIAVVTSNGGPCKTQQDVDKLLLRFDGKSRAEKREAIRCQMLYHKLVLENPDPNLDPTGLNSTQMVTKLKIALPRIKPGYSIVLAPKRTVRRALIKKAPEASEAPENSSMIQPISEGKPETLSCDPGTTN